MQFLKTSSTGANHSLECVLAIVARVKLTQKRCAEQQIADAEQPKIATTAMSGAEGAHLFVSSEIRK